MRREERGAERRGTGNGKWGGDLNLNMLVHRPPLVSSNQRWLCTVGTWDFFNIAYLPYLKPLLLWDAADRLKTFPLERDKASRSQLCRQLDHFLKTANGDILSLSLRLH